MFYYYYYCCDLVVVCFFGVCFFLHLILAGRQPSGVLRWFQMGFFSLIWCQLFACLIRAAILRLPPAFVIWSFFLCHRHLWSVLFFFATGICVPSFSFTAFFCRRHSCETFCFCFVSSCFRISVYLSIFGIMLCACCSSASFFPSRLPCGQPYKFRFEANPIWYSAIKFAKSHSAKCSLHKWA